MAREKKIKTQSRSRYSKEVRSKACNYSSEKICWQFSTMDLDGPFKFCGLRPETWAKILSVMKEWDKKTWAEVMGGRDHFISVDALSDRAVKRLEEIERDDSDGIYSLHIGGESRFIGVRDRFIFQVLWWDPNHEVCPSHKKST